MHLSMSVGKQAWHADTACQRGVCSSVYELPHHRLFNYVSQRDQIPKSKAAALLTFRLLLKKSLVSQVCCLCPEALRSLLLENPVCFISL